MKRTAQAHWSGDLKSGAGTVSMASGTLSNTPYSFHSRFEQGKGTNPEELLAAAHGGCITMSLAGELTKAGTPPGHLQTTVTIHMDEIEGQGHQIVGSVVEFVVEADGVDDAALQAALREADEGCPFSALLKRAGATVDVSARLA